MNDVERSREARVEVMGQVIYYPQTIWGVLSIVSVIIGICVLVWIITVKANPNNIKAINQSFVIARSTSEQTDPIEGRYQIQFWTPSVMTKQSADIMGWEKIDTDEKLDNFADYLLKDSRVRGYRRYDVIGQGIGNRRKGMWWVLTVDNDYEVVDFVKAYQEFWKSTGSIYVEVLRSSVDRHIQ